MQYIEITQLLNEYGPQTINQMSSSMRNLNPIALKQALDFLSKSKIIEGETMGANLRYALTERGIGVLTFFKVKPSKQALN
jgi:DNA-binding HxlR family transcriptional regulator